MTHLASKMKLGLISILSSAPLILFLINATNAQRASNNLLKKPGCTVDELNRVDRAIARLLTAGPHGRKVPENFEQLKPFCGETKNLSSKVEAFIQRCYTKEISQYARIAMYSVKKTIKTFCGVNNKRSKKLQQFLSKANPCINKHLRKNDTCIVNFISDMQATFHVDDKLKIPYLCCHTLKSLQCLESELDRHECSRQNHELIMEFVRSNTDDFFSIGCSDYSESSDKCSQLKPLKPTNSHSKQKRLNKNARVYITPVFVMIDLISSIGNTPAK